jgi:hypothetical protein
MADRSNCSSLALPANLSCAGMKAEKKKSRKRERQLETGDGKLVPGAMNQILNENSTCELSL